MKRLFWAAVGAALGVVAMRRLSARAARFTPQGLADQARERAGGLGASVRVLADEVRSGIERREKELADALLSGDDGRRDATDSGIDPEVAERLLADRDAGDLRGPATRAYEHPGRSRSRLN